MTRALAIVISMVAGLIVLLINEWAGPGAERLVRLVARGLPCPAREVHEAEWLEQVDRMRARGQPVSALLWGLWLILCLPALKDAVLGAALPWHRRAAKRGFDLALSSLLMLTLLPALVGVTLALLATTRGPVFFRQERVGRDGEIFPIYKFRTWSVSPATIPD